MNDLQPATGSVGSVAWEAWSAGAFARAAAEGKPVLLSITAAWCHGCGVMDAMTYADPRIVSAIHASVVPVRVDADRRPDINERYHLEGWPTTAFLTPSGEVLTGTTYLPPSGFAALLDEVVRAYSTGRESLDARARAAAEARRAGPKQAPASEPDLSAPEWLASRVVAEQDLEFGGFGTGGKFLHAPALLAGVRVYEQQPSDPLAAALARTLDGMARGGIRDHVDGGFFRYAGTREWMRPHTEKMLEDQAAMVLVYFEAARVFDRPDWQHVALDVMAYVRRTLADSAARRFFGSQAADDAYYQMRASGLDGAFRAPRVDRTLFVDWTSQAVAAWVRAADLTGDRTLLDEAVAAMECALESSGGPGAPLAHAVDGAPGVRGLLTDHVHASRALLDLFEATGDRRHASIAEDLMRAAVATLWDARSGGFLDRSASDPDAIGLLADPRAPLSTNAAAASVLARLARVTGDAVLHEKALQTLRAHTGGYRQHGLAAAPYALAILDIFEEA